MTLRSASFSVGLAVLLLLGRVPGGGLWAQDRGAPRFASGGAVDTVEGEASEAGRLWSLAAPPFDRLERTYGIGADSAWANHLRRGLLRLPGCTAAFVSPDGLALTAARCVRRHLEASAEVDAVVAEQRGAERSVPGLTAEHLVGTVDVTAAVRALHTNPDTSRQQAVQIVERRRQAEAKAGRRVDVVSAAGGARYTAYTYRPYDDVRLVFLPEEALSAFGGVEAALTYPRSALDAALLRVYDGDDTPVQPPHFFDPSTQGVRPETVLVGGGFAAETHRAESAAQLAVHRDLILPARQARLETWTRATTAYRDTATAPSGQGSGALLEGQTALKETRTRLQALQNDYVLSRLQRRDERLRGALQRDPALGQRFGGVLDSLAAIQSAKRDLAPSYRAFGGLVAGTYTSVTLRRALLAFQALRAEGARRQRLLDQAAAVPPQPAPVDAALMADRLEALQTHLSGPSAPEGQLLDGNTPANRAASVVKNSALSESAPLRALQKGERLPEEDPALALVDAFAGPYEAFREEWSTLTRREATLTQRLARARHAVQVAPVLPAADRAPRLTDGRVLGYPYNGTTAPPFTTLYGLYGQSRSFEGTGAWALPERWRQPPAALDRSTPLNFVASTDVALGPGAPLLNQYLEIVGVGIGPNIQGVAGAYLFLPERMRTVAVDLRGLRQVLASVYGAEALVDEVYGRASDAEGPSR